MKKYVYVINAWVTSNSVSVIADTQERAEDLARQEFAKKGLSEKNVNYRESFPVDVVYDPEMGEVRAYREGNRSPQKCADPDNVLIPARMALEEEYLRKEATKWVSEETPAERMERLWREEEGIINLTQHAASDEQRGQSVIDLEGKALEELKNLLTFTALPEIAYVEERARSIANLALASHCKRAMIGGAPFLMAPLQHALEDIGIEVLYAFTMRISEEVTNSDGSVTKSSIFKHAGFVGAKTHV